MTSYYERTGRFPANVTPHRDPVMERLRLDAANTLHDKGREIFQPGYVRSREMSEEVIDAIAVYVLARVREILP